MADVSGQPTRPPPRRTTRQPVRATGLSAGSVAIACRRGRRVPLTRDLVLRTALTLIDADGVEALTMRRLGDVLERDPMAIYRHTATKADLLDGVVEHVLGSLAIDAGAADWSAELRRTGHALREVALLHPNTVALIVTRPPATPLGMRPLVLLRPLEAFLALMTRAGLDPAAAVRGYRAFSATVAGHLLDEVQEVGGDPDAGRGAGSGSPDPGEGEVRLALYRLPADGFPLVRSAGSALVAYDGRVQLDGELDMVLGWLAAQLPDPAA